MRISRSFVPTALKGSKHYKEKGGSVETWVHEFEYTKSDELPPHLEQSSPAKKLEWLRSQIIGNHIEYLTPFGKRLVFYADHTASGRSLMFIEKYILQNVLPVYGNTHTGDNFVGERMTKLVEEATAYVKRCLGGTDSDVIFLCGTGSTAAIKKLQEIMGLIVAPPLRQQTQGMIEEKKRWVVYVGPYEHHSNLLSWRQSLAEVVQIPLSKDGTIDTDTLRAELQNPKYNGRSKLGSFSGCSNVTGIVTNTRTISKLLHAHGCFACFDFAASGPYVEIDMRSGQPDGYDAVFVSPHKFMGGPGTSGVLLMAKSLYLLGTGPPSTCGGGIVNFVNDYEQDTVYFDEIERREDAGTPGNIQKIRTGLTFWVKELIGTDVISSRETVLVDMALSRLSSNPNMRIYGGTTVNRIAILSFNIESSLSHGEEPSSGLYGYNGSLKRAEGKYSPARLFVKGGRRNPLINPIKKGVHGNYRTKQFLSSKEEIARGKPLHGRFITKLLNDLFGIQARGGCSCAGPYGLKILGIDDELGGAIRESIMKGRAGVKPGWARVSFGYYITSEDFEFLIAAIEFIAEYGQRLLQLYDFDWSEGDWTFKEEYKSVVEEAERFVASKVKHQWWPLHHGSDFTRNGCLSFSSTRSSHDFFAKKLNPNHIYYMHVAVCTAESFPDQSPVRDIPEDVNAQLLTFRV